MSTRLAQNLQVFAACIGNLYSTPIKAWIPVIASAIVLSLPIGVYMTASSVGFFSFLVQQPPEMTVFLSKNIELNNALSVRQRIAELPAVQSASLISEDDALQDFKRLTGISVANYLQENPFSTIVVVQPDQGYFSAQAFQELSTRLNNLDNVDLVEFDQDWAEKLHSLQKFTNNISRATVILLSLAAVFVVCYMSRWPISDRIDELKLLSLIGASRSFIYRPFVYSAVLQTILIMAVAFLLVEGIRMLNREPVADLIALYGIGSEVTDILWHVWALAAGAVLLLNVVTIRVSVYLKLRDLEKDLL